MLRAVARISLVHSPPNDPLPPTHTNTISKNNKVSKIWIFVIIQLVTLYFLYILFLHTGRNTNYIYSNFCLA